MNMTTKGATLPAQGERTPRARREGSTVPAALPSSSNDGLPLELQASLGGEDIIASMTGGEEKRRRLLRASYLSSNDEEDVNMDDCEGGEISSKMRTTTTAKISAAATAIAGTSRGRSSEVEAEESDLEGTSRKSRSRRKKTRSTTRSTTKKRSELSDTDVGGRSRSSRRGKVIPDSDQDPDPDPGHYSDSSVEYVPLSGEVGKSRSIQMSAEMRREVRDLVRDTIGAVDQEVGRDSCPTLADVAKEGGRGRPSTTGDHYLKMLRDARRQLLEAARDLRILREGMTPANLSANRRREEKKALQELSFTPIENLPGMILEAVNTVDTVNEKSHSLKGEFRGSLNKSAAMIKAATTLLVQRQERSPNSDDREDELEMLRSRIAAQDKELTRLGEVEARYLETQKEIHDLRGIVEVLQNQMQAQMEQSQDIMAKRKDKDLKRRRVMDPSSSSGEEEAKGGNQDPKEQMERMDVIEGSEEQQEESSYNRVREDIDNNGMPAAYRPSLQGVRKIIEPEMPPATLTPRTDLARKEEEEVGVMKDRLASMLVTCMNERMDKLEKKVETLIERKLNDRLKDLPIGNEGKNKASPPPQQAKLVIPNNRDKIRKEEKTAPNTRQTRSKTNESRSRSRSQVLRHKTSTQPISPSEKLTQSGPAPPSKEQEKEGEWTQVGKGKKNRQRKKKDKKDNQGQTQTQTQPKGKKAETGPGLGKVQGGGRGAKGGKGNQPKQTPQASAKKAKKRRVPRTAAVTLTCPDGEYAETLGLVRRRIDLKDCEIEKISNVRRTATGAISLEISGQGCSQKADALASRIAEVLAEKEGIRIGRPTMTADLRLSRLEPSVTETEVQEALAEKGKVGIADVAVGQFRESGFSQRTVVVKCPLSAALALSKEGKITLGWSQARVALLEQRPLQCFKCLEYGHTRATCKNEADRTGACYRCGELGHSVKECQGPAKCAVCSDKGLPAEHRIGGPSCKGCTQSQMRRKKDTSARKEGLSQAKEKKEEKKKKPEITSNLETKGFQVTYRDGKRGLTIPIATLEATNDPPKEQRKRPARGKTGKKEAPIKLEAPTPMEVEKETEPTPEPEPKAGPSNEEEPTPMDTEALVTEEAGAIGPQGKAEEEGLEGPGPGYL